MIGTDVRSVTTGRRRWSRDAALWWQQTRGVKALVQQGGGFVVRWRDSVIVTRRCRKSFGQRLRLGANQVAHWHVAPLDPFALVIFLTCVNSSLGTMGKHENASVPMYAALFTIKRCRLVSPGRHAFALRRAQISALALRRRLSCPHVKFAATVT